MTDKTQGKRELTDKQALFVDEYLKDLNATQAAIRAKYSPKTASRIGPELLGKTWVAAAIAERQAKLSKIAMRTAADVLADIGRVRASAMQEVLDPEVGVVSMMSYQHALKALEMEGKHIGMWTDKLELTGKGGGAIEHNLTISPADAYERLMRGGSK